MEPIVFFVPVVIAIIAIVVIAVRRRSQPVEVDRNELLDLSNRWQPPVELSLPAPRPVRLTGQGKVTFGIFVLIALLMLGVAYFSGRNAVREMQRQHALEQAGVVTEGEVVRKREGRAGKNTRYYITYRFETRQGQRFYQQTIVRRSYYQNTREGDRVQVRYLPEMPEVNGLAEQSQGGEQWLFLIAPAVGLGIAFIILVPFRQQKRLLE